MATRGAASQRPLRFAVNKRSVRRPRIRGSVLVNRSFFFILFQSLAEDCHRDVNSRRGAPPAMSPRILAKTFGSDKIQTIRAVRHFSRRVLPPVLLISEGATLVQVLDQGQFTTVRLSVVRVVFSVFWPFRDRSRLSLRRGRRQA